MKKVFLTFLILIILILIILILTISKETEDVIIPSSAIRFRVIANTNSVEDQNLKLKVRDNVQSKLSTMLVDKKNINEVKTTIQANMLNIEKVVAKTINDSNNKQTYNINYGKNYFPKKIYKGVTYKAGNYDSLVIKLGNANGNNWWCVLFPPLCLLEAEETTNTSDIEYKSFIKEIIEKYF